MSLPKGLSEDLFIIYPSTFSVFSLTDTNLLDEYYAPGAARGLGT